MSHPPNTIRWEKQATEFLDSLTEIDLDYIDVSEAIERIVQSGHWNAETNLTFVHNGHPFLFHRVPPNSPRLKPLDVFSYQEDNGLIVIEIVTFAP